MWEAFALQKLLSFLQQKNISVFGYKVVKHLTSWPLNDANDALNNWALIYLPDQIGMEAYFLYYQLVFEIFLYNIQINSKSFPWHIFPKLATPWFANPFDTRICVYFL